MARVKSPRNHDWLGVNVSFLDGRKANVTWSRGSGEKIAVLPPNPAHGETLSNIVVQSMARMGKEGCAYANLGDIADVMERVGREARTLEGYLDTLKAELQVTGNRPRPKGEATAPDATVSTVRKSRGWNVVSAFPNGEKLDIQINAKSIAYIADPKVPSRDSDIMNFLFSVKGMGVMGDEELANLVKTKAEESTGIDGWLEGMRASFAPAGPRR